MSTIPSIKSYLANIDYGWTKPASLVVFVPGLSLYTLNQQLSCLFKTFHEKCTSTYNYHSAIESKEYKKLTTMYKAHMLGSVVQAVACIAAVQFAGLTAFAVPALFAIYEFTKSLRGLNHEAIKVVNKKIVITP